MAEAIALYLANKIGDALVTEGINNAKSLTKSLNEVHGQMREIQSRLELLQAFLQHADEHRNEDKVSAAWVKLVRELVFKIEDLVDLYTYTMAMRSGETDENFFSGLLQKGFRKAKKMKPLKYISDELKVCYIRLDNLSKDKITFGVDIPSTVGESSRNKALFQSKQLAESAHFIPDEDVIGIDDQKAQLIEWLIDDRSTKRKVISLWGMGGIGKTTLVTRVYKNASIVSHFECRAWVSVSQNYVRDDLIRKIIKELHRESKSNFPSLESEDYRDMGEILTEMLTEKRYLIILDDIWVTTVWEDLSSVICKNNINGRVVITTRIQDVARVAYENHTLELKPLDENNARTLFYHHVFSKQRNKNCPGSLKEWAEKIMYKCDGLPLAIVWISNYLATKEQSEFAWKSAYNMLINSEEKNVVNAVLNLSINNLPYYLRSCFLYCSIFPEDYEIRRKILLRLWISEGFIVKGKREITDMEVAEDYLDQLVSRSMFQVARRNVFGRVKTLRIHDLVLEMIMKKKQHESLYEVWDRTIHRGQDIKNVRCLSIFDLDGKGNHDNRHYCTPQLRTLHLFSQSISNVPFSDYKLLWVLNLQRSRIKILPEEICILFNLRYLSIRSSEVEQLPKCICKLQNLETLDFSYCPLKNMPQGFAKLYKLQHLFGYSEKVDVAKGIHNLKYLQTLKCMNVTKQCLDYLENLNELRTLYIQSFGTEVNMELGACVAKMKHLIRLSIDMVEAGNNHIDLNSGGLTELPRGLQKLGLYGRLYKGVLPKCLGYFTTNNLKILSFSISDLDEDLIPSIAASSPNLCALYLDCYLKGAVDKLCFPTGSFTTLKFLYINGLHQVKMMEILEDSLVCLETMKLARFREIKALPVGIENLINLKELDVSYMSNEFHEKLCEERSSKLQWISLVKNIYLDDRGTSHTEIL